MNQIKREVRCTQGIERDAEHKNRGSEEKKRHSLSRAGPKEQLDI